MKRRLLSMHMTPYGIIYVHHVALHIISPHFQLTQAVKQSMTLYHEIKRFISRQWNRGCNKNDESAYLDILQSHAAKGEIW